MNPDQLSPDQLSRIAPITDAEASHLVRPGTLTGLAEQITASQELPENTRAHQPSARRRWLIGTPVAVGLAAAALIATALSHPGQRVGPGSVGPGSAGPVSVGPSSVGPVAAQALAFTRQGGYLDVIVRNPLADPARYRAEFARYHLDITLKLVPASPSIVGTVVYFGQSQGASTITPITARGKCHTGGGGAACPVGLRVPVDFHGQAELVFGRAARPGEKYESTASAFAPGEVMHGMQVKGQTVAQVLAALAARQITVPIFNYNSHNDGQLRRHVPADWYVYDATPWASQQVMLFVGPTRQQQVSSGRPKKGQPSPTPTASVG